MSHVDLIADQIRNLDTLWDTCKELGLSVKLNQKHYKWYGYHVGDYPIPDGLTINDMGKCEHCIEVPGAKYDIGVIKDPYDKQHYKLIWDFWDKNLPEILGKDAWKLRAKYKEKEALRAAKVKRKTIRKEKLSDRTRIYVYM